MASLNSYGNLQRSDGSIDLYFGPSTPNDKQNWIKTRPERGFFLYFRAYGPLQPFFDQTWKLNDVKPDRIKIYRNVHSHRLCEVNVPDNRIRNKCSRDPFLTPIPANGAAQSIRNDPLLYDMRVIRPSGRSPDTLLANAD
jgi:Protein of unknown function (DUF1214)